MPHTSKQNIPVTRAIRFLRNKNIPFIPHFYTYQEHGGTALSSKSLGVPEHNVIKTIVLETHEKNPLIVLMHGDCEISTKSLARILDVKSVSPCDPQTAQRHTGYMVGGTSPFGTLKPLPVYAEETIFDLDNIFINGGKRGFLVEISPTDLLACLEVHRISVAVKET